MRAAPIVAVTALCAALAAPAASAAPAEVATGTTGEWRWGLYLEREGRHVCLNHDWAQASFVETPSARDGARSSAPVCALARGNGYRPLFVVAGADGKDAGGRSTKAEGFYGLVPAAARRVQIVYRRTEKSRPVTVRATLSTLPRGFTRKLKLFRVFAEPRIVPVGSKRVRIEAFDRRGRRVARKIYR